MIGAVGGYDFAKSRWGVNLGSPEGTKLSEESNLMYLDNGIEKLQTDEQATGNSGPGTEPFCWESGQLFALHVVI